MIVDAATITKAESNELERAWSELQAYRNILADANTILDVASNPFSEAVVERITHEWKAAQMSVLEVARRLRVKYFGGKYESDEYNFNCDFPAEVLTIFRVTA